MQGTTGFAILGAGSVAGLHRLALTSISDTGARLVAVGHHDPGRAGELGEEFGVPCLTEEEVLAREDVDVVVICTPSGQHARQAVSAARAGKHVLVEKPMAMSLRDADAMIEACESANVKLGVTLQRRAEEPFRSLRDAAVAGELGRLVYGSVAVPYYRPQGYYDSAAWRGTREMDGGALMNQGIHLVDLLVWCMGDPVSASASAGTLVHDMESEDTISAVLSFSGGEVASVSATTAAAPGFPHRIEVYGTAGGVQIEGEKIVRWETAGQGSETDEDADTPGDAGVGRDPTALSVDGHASVYRDFVEAIREDRPPSISGEEGRRSLSAILMMYRSAGIVPESL